MTLAAIFLIITIFSFCMAVVLLKWDNNLPVEQQINSWQFVAANTFTVIVLVAAVLALVATIQNC